MFISSSFLYSSPSSVQCLCTAADLSAYFEALSFYKSPLARGEGLTRCRHICIIQQQLSNLCGWQCLPLTRCQLTQIRLVSRTPFFFPFFKPKWLHNHNEPPKLHTHTHRQSRAERPPKRVRWYTYINYRMQYNGILTAWWQCLQLSFCRMIIKTYFGKKNLKKTTFGTRRDTQEGSV